MSFLRDLFERFIELFRGSISNEIVRELVRLQRERALVIASTVLTDVYVYDGKAYFKTAEVRRHENIYYQYKDGKCAVLEESIQRVVRSCAAYARFTGDLVLQDSIGVLVPLEVCFIKTQANRDLMASPAKLEDRVAAMRRFVQDYDAANSPPTPAQGVVSNHSPRPTPRKV